MTWLRAAVVAFLFIPGFEPAAAQLSCTGLSPLPGPTGYQRRSNADRCEGFYQQQEVSGTLEFLSLVNGTINYDPDSDRTLTVSVPGLDRLQASQIFLAARALRPAKHYRMDAVFSSGTTFKWPLTAVLAPAKLRSDEIGVVAWVNRPLRKYHLPISVIPENVASSASYSPAMLLRPSSDVEVLRWRARRESGVISGDYDTFGGSRPSIIRAGQTVRLELRGQPSRNILVETATKYLNEERMASQAPIRVVIP
jgi:hypothetical protein